MRIEIRFLRSDDIEPIAAAFIQAGRNKPASQYRNYLSQQEKGQRAVLVAFADAEFAGYLTILWGPDYLLLPEQNIPEIQDLNVLPTFRRKGIATQLMNQAEQMISEHSSIAALAVGLFEDYGPAQRLYILRGYLPAGLGITYKGERVKYSDRVVIDDDLVLHLVKTL